MGSRPGAERFTAPTEPNQRRYEALRAYFVEELSAEAVGERFGYTRATVETLVRDFRAGRLELFASSRPGPRSQPRKDRARTLALALRREGRSLREIERALAAEQVPLSKTAIWELASEEGLGRLEAEPEPEPLPLTAPKAKRLADKDWAAGMRISSEHAGLFLLVPELVELDVRTMIANAGYRRPRSLRRCTRCWRCWRSSCTSSDAARTSMTSCTTARWACSAA
jgi:transposase